MSKIIEAIKASGLTKLAYAGIAAVSAIFGIWFLFWGTLGIFLYINANTLYKHIQGIKL